MISLLQEDDIIIDQSSEDTTIETQENSLENLTNNDKG